jgi:hypothetical protein
MGRPARAALTRLKIAILAPQSHPTDLGFERYLGMSGLRMALDIRQAFPGRCGIGQRTSARQKEALGVRNFQSVT